MNGSTADRRTTRIGIHGFGRMGRLALRAGWERDDIEFVALNEPHANAANMALLTEFDSVQGRWSHSCEGSNDRIRIDDRELHFGRTADPRETRWSDLGVDLVLECSGAHRTTPSLQGHFDSGARRVVVSAPVKDGPPNIVVGVNHEAFDLSREPIVTAASCTTNCLAPVVRVIHDAIGIERGLVTTIHDPTNTQSVHDAPHKDPRRSRAAQLSLIPTSTNSATAVTLIIPELAGRLDSIAVRAPVLNASITDCVFQLARDTTVEEVNGALRAAATTGPLVGILGVEDRPLVSADYAGDPRSGIVDTLSTRVTDKRLVKLLVWYDNEWGYANRLIELAAMVGRASRLQ
jgi:glyceraldehyde 3-phosphate dehydrogenase